MSVGHKSSNTLTFRQLLYKRALHPELFKLQDRRLHKQADYEAEAWICPLGHVVRFSTEAICFTETVVDSSDHLPEHGLIHALPCLGEKDYEMEEPGPVGYVTTIQTEALTDHLYTVTFRELQDTASANGALSHEWQNDEGQRFFSMVEVQCYKTEVHFQSYHMVGTNNTVLRTQSIFEIH